MITVDKATHRDIDSLAALLQTLFAFEAEFTADEVKQKAGINLILDSPAIGQILVARKNGDVVGMVNLLFTVSTALGEPVAILDDLVVAPAFRGAGVGRLLMDKAIEFCSERGQARISLQTDLDNNRAQRLYESCGFMRSSMISYKKLL